VVKLHCTQKEYCCLTASVFRAAAAGSLVMHREAQGPFVKSVLRHEAQNRLDVHVVSSYSRRNLLTNPSFQVLQDYVNQLPVSGLHLRIAFKPHLADHTAEHAGLQNLAAHFMRGIAPFVGSASRIEKDTVNSTQHVLAGA
jgi:hypothetical protein